jgi:hypothetical protein
VVLGWGARRGRGGGGEEKRMEGGGEEDETTCMTENPNTIAQNFDGTKLKSKMGTSNGKQMLAEVPPCQLKGSKGSPEERRNPNYLIPSDKSWKP